MKTTLRASLIAAAIAALPFSASAAGLGRLNVFSVLGQPLRAEVEVSGTADEVDSINARIASPDAFKRANIDYASALSGLRVTVERRSNSAILKLSSDKPFNEPFVDLLLELNWAGGRLVREYTFLLDPSSEGLKPAPAVHATEPAVHSAELAPGRHKQAPVSRTGERHGAAAGRAAAKTIATDGEYTVKSGDTLSRIAGQLKPDDAQLEQMLAALYGANADAFPKGNANRLKAGQILRVPASDQVKTLTAGDVKRLLARPSANFSGYRQKLAAAAAAAPTKESAAQQSASGKITPKAQEPARAPEQKDHLKIAKNQISKDQAKGDKSSAGRIQALEEDLVAREKALKDASERVAALEKNVKNLQKIVELKNQNLSELQKQAAGKTAASKTGEPVKPISASSKPVDGKADETKTAPTAKSEEPAAKSEEAAKPETAVQSAPVVAASSAAVVPKSAASAPHAAASKPAAAPASAPAEEEPGFFASLIQDPTLLGGIGIGVLALGGLLAYRARRKRDDDSIDTTSLNATQTGTESVIGLAGGQTVDTGSSILPTDFSQSGLTSIDTDEGVDPVAEADVYMAYGRDAQAEEILLDALKSDPSRSAIHLKLLEIYSQRKSLKPFESIATDLYTQTGGAGSDWAKAADLGVKLDPENPLYHQTVATEPQTPAEPLINEISFVEPVAAVDEFSTEEPEALDLDLPDDLELPGELEELPETPAAQPEFVAASSSQLQATWTMPGEIGQVSRETPENLAQPVAEQEEAKPQDMGLDFNLDLDVATPEAALSPEADKAVTKTEVEPLRFETPTLDLEGLPFDAEPSAELPAKPAEQPLTLDLDGFGIPSADEEDLGLAPATDVSAEATVDLEKTNFEGGLLDFDFDVETAPAAKVESVDRSGGDLSHGGAATQDESAIQTQPEAQLLDEELDVSEEVTTKLELARAYEEMRDFEGARELLEEVLQDGSASQKQEAEAIIARLS